MPSPVRNVMEEPLRLALANAQDDIKAAEQRVEEARQRRNALIVHATQTYSEREVGRALGVSPGGIVFIMRAIRGEPRGRSH